jgi:hypothetical protein
MAAQNRGGTMHRRPSLVLSTSLAAALLLGSAAMTLAAGRPVAAGQPGAECGEEESFLEPHGFLTDGFANAEARYAGSEGTPSLAHGSSAAVSQYDIACVNFTAAHDS